MKLLAALLISSWSGTALAIPLCLGPAQAARVPDHLNVRFEASLNPETGDLTLVGGQEPSRIWLYRPTPRFLAKRQAVRQCLNLAEDLQRETFRLAVDQMSSSDRLATLMMLTIGMNYGLSLNSGNICAGLEDSQIYQLDNPESPAPGEALLGPHLLVSGSGSEMMVMEGGFGFIYYRTACLERRLK